MPKLLVQMHARQGALLQRIAETKTLSDEDEKTIIEEAKQMVRGEFGA